MPDPAASPVMIPAIDAPIFPLLQQRVTSRPDRRLTFAEYMDLLLYEPQWGYYNQRARQIGARGDFFTSPHLGPEFGQMIAVQLIQMWEILGQPRSFQVAEMGAGQGLLAQDILRWIRQRSPQCFAALEYIIVEKAIDLIAVQKQHLLPEFESQLSLSWKTLADLALRPIVGCLFSNELVDALPVHQVRFAGGQLQELYVAIADGAIVDEAASSTLVEQWDQPSTPDLATYFEDFGLQLSGPNYPDPYRTEVNLAARDWLRSVAAGLSQGYVLTIDYGYPATRYYSRVRDQGTLQCYYQHRHHSDPYVNLGQQDITAHVNFTALEQWGQQVGLETLDVTQQAMFLMALGLGDVIAALGQSDSTDPQEILQRLRQRDALHQLINPMGLGNFGVLLQGKGLTSAMRSRPLRGLARELPRY
jgi:SAM-dependent MidA family methyltransferase